MTPDHSPKVFFSICIPAYKRPENFRRLLQSISIQTFRDFEVIITDDSPDKSVKEVLNDFPSLAIRYYKNDPSLGTPANWNNAIAKAQGQWIKIMHDDDWFASEKSLEVFAEKADGENLFIVSRYCNVFETGRIEKPGFPTSWKKRIIDNPEILLARNVIGPPSVTLIHHSITQQYDIRMKWRVDMDYYIRLLKDLKSFSLIEGPLINVGISTTQVTNSCINMPEVELPEGLLMLQKYGVSPLRNILVYDAWWRILRNVGIRTIAQLSIYTPGEQWPEVICRMVRHQATMSKSLLKIGVFSKSKMLISYISNRKYLKT